MRASFDGPYGTAIVKKIDNDIVTFFRPYGAQRRVEKMTDHLDRLFMRGSMTQREYDAAMRDLALWADGKRDKPLTVKPYMWRGTINGA